MYVERVRRNLVPVIEAHGFKVISNTPVLDCISSRQLWNLVNGKCEIKLNLLERIADEIGADMLDFLK